MQSVALGIARFSLGLWVGAASFFVFVIVSLRASPLFETTTKLDHARVLFPLYYRCGFTLMAVALLASLLAWGHPETRRTAYRLYLALLAGALLLTIADAFWIYAPLYAMLSSDPLPPEFHSYHVASRWINTLALGLSAVAAGIIDWPTRPAPTINSADSPS